jgi:hypothetical protein
MSANWFFTQYPPSRSVIENSLRLAFWKAGLTKMWFSCTKDTAPFACFGFWSDTEFSVVWEPKSFLRLEMKTPNQALLDAFERVLGHKALAAYRDDAGGVIVEWRAKNAGARFEELESANTIDLERLDK